MADAAFDEWVKKRCPLGRWATPDEIAWPVCFLRRLLPISSPAR